MYYAKYYGRGGDGRWGKKMKNEELAQKIKKGGKITWKKGEKDHKNAFFFGL